MAISEEFANDASGKIKSGGLIFDRRVTRIITPGTLIDEKFMDPFENNFLLAIRPGKALPEEIPPQDMPQELRITTALSASVSKPIGLAWLDLSTGDFFTQTVEVGTLSSALARVGARETVLSNDITSPLQQSILHILEQDRYLVTRHSIEQEVLPISTWSSMLERAVPPAEESSFTEEEIAAGGLLLGYVKENLQGLGIKLQPPKRRHNNENMEIDKNSLKGLEVLETAREGSGGGKGSLLHSVRRTITKSGTRLLKDWIGMSLSYISATMDMQLLHSHPWSKALKTFRNYHATNMTSFTINVSTCH